MTGYLPMDREERREMLASVGVDLDQLFAMIPDCDCVRVAAYEALQNVGMSEQEVAEEVKALAAKNSSSQSHDSYLGAGYYDHYQPAAVQHLISRSEFLTSYTPYQAEISQGTLQAIFEWQSYITRLTGLPVANASLYDAASGAAEAALLACRDKRLYKVFVSEGVHPDTLETIRTYCHAAGIEVVTGPLDENGRTSEFPQDKKEYAGFLVQSPNFYGVVEDLDLLAEKAHEAGALAVVSQDPVSLAILKRPDTEAARAFVEERLHFSVAVGVLGHLRPLHEIGTPFCFAPRASRHRSGDPHPNSPAPTDRSCDSVHARVPRPPPLGRPAA